MESKQLEMFGIFTIFCLIVACFVMNWFYIRLKKLHKTGIPAPYAFFLFVKLLLTKQDVIKTYQLLNRKYGDIFRDLTFIFASGPEYLQIMFTNPGLQQRPKPKAVAYIIGDRNLLTVDGHSSKVLKRLYYRYFVNRSHIHVLEKVGDELLAHLDQNVQKRWFCIGDSIRSAIVSAVLRTSTGEEIGTSPKVNDVAWKELDNWMVVSILRNGSILHRNDFLFYRFLGGQKFVNETEDMSKVVIDMIEEKKREIEENIVKGKPQPDDFLSGLIHEKAIEEQIDVKAEFLTLQAAALGTTSVAISFALLMLGMHPEIQEMVYEEDKRICEELRGRKIEDSDMSRYEYLQRVIKETMRLYPPIPTIFRYATEDVQMGGYVIPKGTRVIGVNISVHRDPDLFADPLKFDPDRFTPENVKKIQKNTYVPFSTGLRSCPGARYSVLSATFFLSKIVRDYTITSKYRSIKEVDDNIRTSITLYDKNDYPIFLEKRF